MDVYVYYRVAEHRGAELQARAGALLAMLKCSQGVEARLKRRPESQGGLQTWMEVYLDVPEGFGAELECAVAKAQLLPLIEGERHVEYFVDDSPCA